MKINTKDLKNNVKLMTLEGQISEATIGLVQDTFSSIFNLKQHKIICDMKKVEHISAPVLMNFLENISKARDRGGDVKLLDVPAELKGIFRYAGFNDDKVFCDNLKAATQELNNIVNTQFQDNVDDPFGSTIQTNNLSGFKPISPLSAPSTPSPAAPQNVEDPFGATIQTNDLSGFKSVSPVSPLSPASPLSPPKPAAPAAGGVDDPFAATIQTTNTSGFTPVSPLSPPKTPSNNAPVDDPFGATIQTPNFVPKKDPEQDKS
ncbi:STAS domain-containing protein [Candidatus Uabimicrobium amorphum]|uniref:Anti-sigma factor antagonist n=1 Tax=Uabimicrobium amorphum TaxID=2596890 RepID=A0A5S9ISI7_UABAM|nr:STAS domain-containing protein [Candidatus Uabimicrobium amorphum]BBM86937.1 anti-sigma factor antagonist [Candidatus Uabimicrobium amorphum]